MLGLTLTCLAQTKPAATAENFGKIIKFYPNPATTAINFEFLSDFNKTFSLQLYNFMGKKVYETVPNSPAMYLSLDDFFRGVYIYQLRDKFGKIVDSGKFQVVK